MTEHKTMNTVIHAAFRRDLQRFATALATFPVGARDRAEQLGTAWDNFSFQLHHHHQDEETIFWPALRSLGAPEEMAEDLESEHVHMLGALASADTAMGAFRREADARTAATAAGAVADLTTVLLDHLAHEERDMEPISAANHASPQIKQAQKVVRKAHRGNQGTLFAWLEDRADADALRGLRREIPRPVLYVMTRTSGRRYRRTVAPTWA